VPASDELCSWQPNLKCAQAFEYKGVGYTGCTKQDYPTPWCSLDELHKGAFETCTKVCTSTRRVEKKEPTSASSVDKKEPEITTLPKKEPTSASSVEKEESRPTAPASSPVSVGGDACERQPGNVNDSIGNTATLDQDGYRSVTSAESPEHMKRFICRVVANVGCRVTDVSALVTIVSYYMGAANDIRYESLATDLSDLCRAGDKFVVSQPSL